MRKTPSHEMDEFQLYTNPMFQSLDVEDDNYDADNSCPTSPRDLHLFQSKIEPSNIVVMPNMVIGTINFREQLAGCDGYTFKRKCRKKGSNQE